MLDIKTYFKFPVNKRLKLLTNHLRLTSPFVFTNDFMNIGKMNIYYKGR